MKDYIVKDIEILGKYVRVKVRPQEDGTEVIDDPASVQAIKDVFAQEQKKKENQQKMVGASTVAIAIILLIALVISFLGGA